MRTLEELGISPAPWTLGSLIIGSDGLRARSSIDADDESVVAGDGLIKEADARLMVKSPLLYDMLHKLVEACRSVGYNEFDSGSSEAEHKLYAILDEAEVALNEAADEPTKL